MFYVVTGGSASGKSEYAENLACNLKGEGRLIYLATMSAGDIESQARIAKHRTNRAGKGFVTVEKSKNISEIIDDISKKDTILVEDLSNLLANELFEGDFETDFLHKSEKIADKIVLEIYEIVEKSDNCVIVANEIYNDDLSNQQKGGASDKNDTTKVYISQLGKIVNKLGLLSDHLIEIVCGIEVNIK